MKAALPGSHIRAFAEIERDHGSILLRVEMPLDRDPGEIPERRAHGGIFPIEQEMAVVDGDEIMRRRVDMAGPETPAPVALDQRAQRLAGAAQLAECRR